MKRKTTQVNITVSVEYDTRSKPAHDRVWAGLTAMLAAVLPSDEARAAIARAAANLHKPAATKPHKGKS